MACMQAGYPLTGVEEQAPAPGEPRGQQRRLAQQPPDERRVAARGGAAHERCARQLRGACTLREVPAASSKQVVNSKSIESTTNTDAMSKAALHARPQAGREQRCSSAQRRAAHYRLSHQPRGCPSPCKVPAPRDRMSSGRCFVACSAGCACQMAAWDGWPPRWRMTGLLDLHNVISQAASRLIKHAAWQSNTPVDRKGQGHEPHLCSTSPPKECATITGGRCSARTSVPRSSAWLASVPPALASGLSLAPCTLPHMLLALPLVQSEVAIALKVATNIRYGFHCHFEACC